MPTTTTKPTPKKPKLQPNTSTPKIPKLDAADLRAYVRDPGPDPDPKVITYNVDLLRDQLAKAKAKPIMPNLFWKILGLLPAIKAKITARARRNEQAVLAIKATIREFAPTCPQCEQGILEYRWGTLRRDTPDSDEPPKKSRYRQCPECETLYLDGLAGIDVIDGERKCPLCQGTLGYQENLEWISECADCEAQFHDLSRSGRPARVSVNQNQTRAAAERPEYVKEIAWEEVDVAVADPANMAVLRKLLVDTWAENHVSPSLTNPQPRAPQEVTVADMVAQLAAIHDDVCTDRPKIAPADWRPALEDGPTPGYACRYRVLGKMNPDKAQLQSYWDQVKAELPAAVEPDGAEALQTELLEQVKGLGDKIDSVAKSDGKDTSPDATGEVPWDPNNPDCKMAKEIKDEYDNKEIDQTHIVHLTYDKLRRFVLEPRHDVIYMRKWTGKRAELRIHAESFARAFKQFGKLLATTAATPTFMAQVTDKLIQPQVWDCDNCGRTVRAPNRPEECPQCHQNTMVKRKTRRS